MKRFMFFALILVIASALMISCGSSNPKVAASDPGAMEVIEDPFQDLTDLANKIIESGGVAAVGQGTSARQDLAKKKAVTDAMGNLAQVFNTKVQRLNKSFQEEIGSANDSEINEAFTTVTKTLTSQLLRGAVTKKVKFLRNKETGQITAAAVVAIDPKTLNQSILDELQNKKPQLYQRFRATKAYEELKKEMEDYEKQQQGF
ncbi:hypothetical protein [Caldithrix abyssi]|uniref:LPP20 lipoprotein n=1 Tax=Caldithrix abyssi DSM 13497 TaxID=880073 RepID=H1XS17_CALAY|nr:hypothetical protein [Caldithrix abyssi]APF18510.1 hypothetical protein Cabys_1761 [Caldithrix abyssi DSM 13497]EHO42510.1 hypothetical protein Calab_2903 [Caldithrix abyssi DSM 13497]